MMGRKGTFTDYVRRRWVSGGLLAIAAVARAVKTGELPRAKDFSCVDCAKPAVEYDHRDYNFPLKVEPVCRRCNILRGSAVPKQWESREALEDYLGRSSFLASRGVEWHDIPAALSAASSGAHAPQAQSASASATPESA